MNAKASLILRRMAVIAAVVGSLVVGAASIQAAGRWTASEAPLAAPPITVETLSAQLAAERERTAALTAQVEAMTGQTADLAAGLDAANAQIQKDAATAKALRDRMTAAKKKLTALNRQIAATERQAAAARATVRTVVVTRPAAAPPAPRPTQEPEDDD